MKGEGVPYCHSWRKERSIISAVGVVQINVEELRKPTLPKMRVARDFGT